MLTYVKILQPQKTKTATKKRVWPDTESRISIFLIRKLNAFSSTYTFTSLGIFFFLFAATKTLAENTSAITRINCTQIAMETVDTAQAANLFSKIASAMAERFIPEVVRKNILKNLHQHITITALLT